MAIKYSTRRWHLKKQAEWVLFNSDVAVCWAPKRIVEPTTWVQNALDSGQMWLFII